MSLNIDMKIILPVKLSGVSFNLNSKLLTSWLSCNVLNPGKYSTRIPLARRQFCPSFCISVNFWTTSICLPMQCLIGGSRSPFQDTIQNLKIGRFFCAEDWWFVHHQSRQIFPWRAFQVNCLHSIDLIWMFGHQFFGYVEHLFHCHIFWILDGIPIVWVILLHAYRCLQCWRHEHSPY